VPRLELLGHTLKSAQTEYETTAAICLEGRQSYQEDDDAVTADLMTFPEFRQFVSAASIIDLDNTFVSGGRNEHKRFAGRFSDEGLKARLPSYEDYGAQAWSERSYFGMLIGFLHPYTLLRLFAENQANLAARLEWQYGPLVFNGGYAEEDEFVPGARRTQTYLIATEGSSDTHILKRAFGLLRPEIADFFRFIDVSERHPFSGIGSLVKFAEGLAKIDVQNRTVFLFDNDAEGQSAFRKVEDLSLPINMRTMVLPHLKEFESFPTIGPGGQVLADINGRAASIECYLDLHAKGSPPPLVRWTNYKEDVNTYHGALQDKERYTRVFFDNAGRGGTYNTAKLSSVLEAVVGVCTAMAEDMRAEER
jgi:HEPN/Toprim N-terminal domain 1